MAYPARVCYGWNAQCRAWEARSMKWVMFVLVVAVVFLALWYFGFFEEFFGPWAAWANFIGYFK
jgi:hypothetical protein